MTNRKRMEVIVACHTAMDRSWRQLIDDNNARAEPYNIVCQSGCAACCTQLPDTTTAEGEVLAWRIQHSSPVDRAEALARLYAWEWEFGQFARDNAMVMPHDDWRGHLLWRARWQLRRVACPFLEDDLTCGVYENRPATCRAHHACMPPADSPEAAKPPPESCFADPVQTAAGELRRQWTIRSDLSDVFSTIVKDNLEMRGLEFKTFVLVPVVLLAGRRQYGWPPPSTEPPARPVRVLTTARIVQ